MAQANWENLSSSHEFYPRPISHETYYTCLGEELFIG